MKVKSAPGVAKALSWRTSPSGAKISRLPK
jgi:hypothetical protein